jgi:cellulose synthase/poly-beta-1,6-N-acetylglucosamine synthase-like glycosyltransferase
MILATIILCARNESEILTDTIQDILNQEFAEAFELIIVDDFSTDNTIEIAEGFAVNNKNVIVLNLRTLLHAERQLIPNKKEGISIAIEKAKGRYIVTTDADCSLGKSWLQTMVNCAQREHAAMVCGPVAIVAGNGLLHQFQEMDIIAMMAMTKWSLNANIPMLNNGANLLYEKIWFEKLNPYQNNKSEYSGDDVFLLQKFFEAKQKVVYCENEMAIVETKVQNRFRDFFHQRVRWAGKSQSYTNSKVKLFLTSVYLLNLIIFCLLILSLFIPQLAAVAIILLLIKISTDYFILKPQLDFFRKRRLLPFLPIMDFMHMIYVVFFGVFSFKKSYIWKDRTINRQL